MSRRLNLDFAKSPDRPDQRLQPQMHRLLGGSVHKTRRNGAGAPRQDPEGGQGTRDLCHSDVRRRAIHLPSPF